MLLTQEIFFMDAKAEKVALFRYGLIAPLVLESLPRGELTRRAQEIAARHYEIPHTVSPCYLAAFTSVRPGFDHIGAGHGLPQLHREVEPMYG
jgi:hypothetical protein